LWQPIQYRGATVWGRLARRSGTVSGACAPTRRSPRPGAFPPSPPRPGEPGVVRGDLWYYAPVRLLMAVHHRLRLHAFPMRTRRLLPVVGHEISRFPRKERAHMPGSQTAQGRRAAAITPPAVLPSAVSTASAPRSRLSRLNGWPLRSPVNASTHTSRRTPHDSGPVWIATPSRQWTFTTYSLPVSRRTETAASQLPQCEVSL